ncbi:hypothetical protein WOLCODRAFT_114704 [Wolfiporia cocos MD-104 SS10]|uniref:Hamartin-domain-containing protein n=1 Tax=Wolfiporia cocos (strain MD-104) TaxID=742152 RepID=A0A2H3JDZ3_WOLCO|nr:hypothetical protein WOLCODRAFT_114704 [Wolfiporia cocos MD-104 SS10]
MAAADLSRPLRLLLESAPEAPSLNTLLTLVDAYALEVPASPNPRKVLTALEDELEEIYNEAIDPESLNHMEIFIEVLYHLKSILPPSSLILTWFDLILKRGLREPRLPLPAVECTKELIMATLNPDFDTDFIVEDSSEEGKQEERERQREKVGGFRRRLMDYYLLDAYNESSDTDALEWAGLDEVERERRSSWKTNLGDVLVREGLQRPKDFLTVTYHCFNEPTYRVQLFILLNTYTSHPDFPSVAHVLAPHPLMPAVLYCLLLDGSSTAAIVGLTVLTKLLPILAVKACEDLKRHLPLLLVVLARIICWREREAEADAPSDLSDEPAPSSNSGSVPELPVREDFGWKRLEATFQGGASSPPSPHRFFTFLYYLFPCNVIRFLRYPVHYIGDTMIDNPYTVPWEEALDEDMIRSKSEPLMHGHVLHPLLIWRGAAEELSQPEFWAQYDIARIVGDCTMLEVRNAALGMQQRAPAVLTSDSASFLTPPTPPTPPSPSASTVTHPAGISAGSLETALSSPTIRPASHTPSSATSTPGARPRVSLQDMIATSIALKSGVDIEVVHPAPSWSTGVVPARTSAPAHASGSSSTLDAVAEEPEHGESGGDDGGSSGCGANSSHGQALAGLQREVLLLRNELNFELWNARENVRHVGRLYQDRVLSKTAEVERQGLHNRLREYKAEVAQLQARLRERKEQASTMNNQYADWNKKLQDRLADMKQEKKRWEAEAAAMRAADKEAKDTFAAQSKLLAAANQRVFQLETREKENKHKVDRLHDYEMQIEQLIKLQRLWEADVQKLNEQAEYIQVFSSKYKKMELRLDTYERTQAELNATAQNYQQQITSLEAQLGIAQRQLETARKSSALAKLSASSAEMSKLTQANQRLRAENSELRDEVEELKAMVEVLKAQVSERRGLVSQGRPSRSGSVIQGGAPALT